MILLIKNLQKQFAKFLKLNYNTWLNLNKYKDLMVKLPNLLLISFILY